LLYKLPADFVSHLAALKVEALVEIAIATQAAIINLDSCICVYPNETVNTTVPVAMVEPATLADREVVFPYLKAFATPYDLDPVLYDFGGLNASFLNDGEFFFTTESLRQNLDYIVLASNNSVTVTFDRAYSIVLVRPHLHVPAGVSAILRISFPDGRNCSDTAIAYTPDFPFLWYGEGNVIACGNQYQDFDFSIGVNKVGYTTNCADPKSAQCINWEQLICTQSGNTVPAVYDY